MKSDFHTPERESAPNPVWQVSESVSFRHQEFKLSLPEAELPLPDDALSYLQRLKERVEPQSVFLFGSRARGDYKPDSDTELGVFLPSDQKCSFDEFLKIAAQPPLVRAYPYCFEDLQENRLVIPMQKELYLREITTNGKTISGEPMIELLVPPPVYARHLLQDCMFWIGRASDCMSCLYRSHKELANALFTKSALAGTRNLMLMNGRAYPKSLGEIVEAGQELDLGDYADIPEMALRGRRSLVVTEKHALRNIHFLEQMVKVPLEAECNCGTDRLIIV